ncbi:hypothetical protein D3C80_1633680 [compost metagenome]
MLFDQLDCQRGRAGRAVAEEYFLAEQRHRDHAQQQRFPGLDGQSRRLDKQGGIRFRAGVQDAEVAGIEIGGRVGVSG